MVGFLDAETDGLSIDFTDKTYFNQPTASQNWNRKRATSSDTFSSPHTFYTNSGTSPKSVKISDSVIGWSPHNMFLNSAVPATQNVTLVTGFTYTVTVTGAGGGNITGSSGASGVATTGSPATFTATGTTGTFTLTGSLDTIQLNRGIVGTAYIATAGAIVNALPISYGEGVWIEPAATNLALRSQELDNAYWQKFAGAATAVADNAIAPDGSKTADKMLCTAGRAAGGHSIEGNGTSTITGGGPASGNLTASAYAKAGTARYVGLSFAHGAVQWFCAVFDIAQGSVTQTGAGAGGTYVSSTIEPVGYGWYRISVTGALGTDNTGNFLVLQVLPAGVGNSLDTTSWVDWCASGSEYVYWWGMMAEDATQQPSSYVQTIAATVTRATDAPNVATSAYPHSATNGTWFAWFKKRLANATNADRILSLNDGTANERMALVVVTGDTPDSIGVDIVDGGAAQVVSTTTKAGSVSSTAGNKGAFVYKANDSAVVADVAAEVTDVVCTMPTVTNLQLGYAQDTASRELNGLIRGLLYVPRRMTGAEVQAISLSALLGTEIACNIALNDGTSFIKMNDGLNSVLTLNVCPTAAETTFTSWLQAVGDGFASANKAAGALHPIEGGISA